MGHYREGRRWLEHVLDRRVTARPADTARALLARRCTANVVTTQRPETAAVAPRRRRHGIARIHLAAIGHYRSEPAGARWLTKDALNRFRKLGFEEGIAEAYNIIGLTETAGPAAKRW